MTDPFAGDDFGNVSGATSGFLDTGAFVGRLVMVKPLEKETGIPSKNKPGETYDGIHCEIHVIDGPAHELYEVPAHLESVRLTGKGLLLQLEPKLRPGKSGWVLGRMIEVPAQVKGNHPARILQEPTAQDVATKDKYVASVIAQRAQGGVTAAATAAPAAQPAPAAMAPKANPFG